MSARKLIRSALLIIDVQESFRHTAEWSEIDVSAFTDSVLKLDHAARHHGVPVVHVFHHGQSGPFRPDSGLVVPMAWLPASPAAIFNKHTHNAFTDTGLDLWLRRQRIEHLVITGIRSEQCCETTTRVAADIGYSVDYVTAATLTFAMTHPASGRTYSADEIKAHTELVLAGRFARIASVAEVITDWQADHPR